MFSLNGSGGQGQGCGTHQAGKYFLRCTGHYPAPLVMSLLNETTRFPIASSDGLIQAEINLFFVLHIELSTLTSTRPNPSMDPLFDWDLEDGLPLPRTSSRG